MTIGFWNRFPFKANGICEAQKLEESSTGLLGICCQSTLVVLWVGWVWEGIRSRVLDMSYRYLVGMQTHTQSVGECLVEVETWYCHVGDSEQEVELPKGVSA